MQVQSKEDSPWTNGLPHRSSHWSSASRWWSRGIAGFFYNASFDTGDDLPRDAVLGILDVNGWHNVFHIATGVVGLALAAHV